MANDTTRTPIENRPGVASAEGALVVLDGPSGMAVTFTPDAAERTAQSLLAAAKEARAAAQ